MAELKGAKGVLKQAYKDAKKKKRTAKKARKYEKSDQFRGPRDPRSMKIKKKNLPEAMGGKIKFQKVPEIDAVKKINIKKVQRKPSVVDSFKDGVRATVEGVRGAPKQYFEAAKQMGANPADYARSVKEVYNEMYGKAARMIKGGKKDKKPKATDKDVD